MERRKITGNPKRRHHGKVERRKNHPKVSKTERRKVTPNPKRLLTRNIVLEDQLRKEKEMLHKIALKGPGL